MTEDLPVYKIAKIIGVKLFELDLNLGLANEQIQILTQENAKLNTILSTCKCQKEINDNT